MTQSDESAGAGASGSGPVVLGRLSGLYGVRGWFRVFSYTDPRDAVLGYDEWLLGTGGRWQKVALEEGRTHGRSILARLEGIEDRDAAAPLVGADIAVPREALPKTGPGEYYWADLVGLEVRHRDGRTLGVVDHLLATGANDVLVVKAADGAAAGSGEILIPFVMDEVVLDVDFAAGVIDVDWEWD